MNDFYHYLVCTLNKYENQIIRDANNQYTYRELLLEAETLGERLKEYPTKKFGILCQTNLNTAKALLACFYANKTAVLLSHRYGDAHNKKIINTVNLTHLIRDLSIDENGDYQSPDDLDTLQDVALIMCTSGTTGTPKGAMITYQNLLTNLGDINAYFEINHTQRILISRPLYHCAVLTGEFLISLFKGLEIVFSDDDFNPAGILRKVEDENISVLCGTPTMFYHLCKYAKDHTYPSLHSIVVSGECMTPQTAARMNDVFQNIRIYNVYGLTEASPRVSYLPPSLFAQYPTSVGYPLKSLMIKIEDGELCVKGNSIMKGYYNNPEATQRILRDGWLHTGDIAEINEHGMLFIKSRKDNMIIRAGMNIYPQEIENALREDPRILDVIAYGDKKDTTGQKICIKVVVDNLSKREVYDICKKHLTLYQLPDMIEIVEKIPRNASGKVIRRN